LNDSGAWSLFASNELLPMLGDEVRRPAEQRIAVGGEVAGLANYESVLEAFSDEPIAAQCEGTFMLYSSGTTGRPKGIKPPIIGNELGAPTSFTALMSGLYGFGEESVYLCPAPLYHAAPIGWTTGAHRLGSTAVV